MPDPSPFLVQVESQQSVHNNSASNHEFSANSTRRFHNLGSFSKDETNFVPLYQHISNDADGGVPNCLPVRHSSSDSISRDCDGVAVATASAMTPSIGKPPLSPPMARAPRPLPRTSLMRPRSTSVDAGSATMNGTMVRE